MDSFTFLPSGALDGASLPFEVSGAQLTVANATNMVSIAPLKGADLGAAIKAFWKLDLPDVGAVSVGKSVTVLWLGQGQWLAVGDVIDVASVTENLSGLAAVTEQSDAWVTLELRGTAANAVMARLCPLDLNALHIDQTARTELAHMMSVITPVMGGFDIMLMRSFAVWGAEHISAAMRSVAGQASLT